jgi:D-alanine-D-alanine ligase
MNTTHAIPRSAPSGVTSVLVLAGGPDAEREVSLMSAGEFASALRGARTWKVHDQVIDRLTLEELRAMPGDVIVPMLHGSFGEGGPLQDLLEQDGRPYVGCGPGAARLAMDKLAIKLLAGRLGIPTPESCVFNPKDEGSAIAPPLVLKPVHDGSSVGLHIVKADSEWPAARDAVIADQRAHPGRAYMVERHVAGQEVTAAVLDGDALPLIEIRPADGPYDYEAKYTRDDTAYVVEPTLPDGLRERIQGGAIDLFAAIGGRHLSRVDFLIDPQGQAWLLEINTMPGFTTHSLVPMAARATGLEMPALCARLVELAWRDRAMR